MLSQRWKLLLSIVSFAAIVAGCGGGDSRWDFAVYNTSEQSVTDISVNWDGQSFAMSDASPHPGSYMTAGLPGPRPKKADLVFTDNTGVKHTISLDVPAPGSDAGQFPCAFFIITGPDSAYVTYKDPVPNKFAP